MGNTNTLKFISNNIQGCKLKIAILSIVQILLGALTVAFSFMLRYVISAIEYLQSNKKYCYYSNNNCVFNK